MAEDSAREELDRVFAELGIRVLEEKRPARRAIPWREAEDKRVLAAYRALGPDAHPLLVTEVQERGLVSDRELAENGHLEGRKRQMRPPGFQLAAGRETMFDFERLFVCRNLRLTDGLVTAEGIGFEHPATLDKLLFVGHVLVPTGIGHVSYKLIVHSLDNGMEIVHRDGYRLMDARGDKPRLAPAWIPVKSRLEPGYYRAILEFPGEIHATTGFRIT